MSPVDEKALLQQGIAAARSGDKASARARFRELTAHNFDNELAWLWLASVADTPAHAIACLRRVLQINPAHDKARAALFRVLMEGGIQTARAGDKAAAFASFSECSTIDPSSELVWTWMASTAPTQAQALDALRRVLHINPSHEQAERAYKKLVVQRGIDLAQAGDADARVVLLEASAVDPGNESVWLWLARSVTPEESIEYYERVLELNPGNTIAIAALQELRPQPSITAPAAHEAALPDEPDLDLDLPDMFGGGPSVGGPNMGGPGIGGPSTGGASFGSPSSASIGGGAGADGPGLGINGNASAGAGADTSGMVVEQFRKEGAEAAQLTVATQAATQEEFLVYTNAESTEVWAPPGTGAAVAEEESAAAFEEVTGNDGGTLDIGTVDEQTLEVAVAQMEMSVSEQDAMGLSLAPAASPSSGVQLSDVDSYVAGAESTYASSARAAAGQPRFAPPAVEEEDPEVVAAEMALRAIADEQAAAEAAAAEAAAAEAAAQEAAAQEAAAQEAAAAASAASTPEPAATPVAPAAPAASNEPNAWDCPICLSGAPQSASRCPTCGSVVSLLDPDLLLETEPVDRRHVLQVVARIKNRKVTGGRQQFDHHFTLGLAFVNAGRTTEGLQQLRAAAALRKNDNDLKAQIDTLERRAAQRAKNASAKPASTPPAPVTKVNGTATKTPEARVDLPAAPAGGEDGAEAGATTYHGSTNGNGNRRIILVVDDSPTIQKVVSVTLEAHGHEVVTASDGMEALAKLRTLRPDLVLLDITMPHMDGYQLCRILRSNELTKQVPIVMLSGKDGLFDKMRGRMAGAATYITKPFAPSALPPLVEKYCKRA